MQEQRFYITGLATVIIDQSPFNEYVKIVLDPAYRGDLNDLEQTNGLPPGVLFEGNSAKGINDPLLARFIETLHHWDYDHDGVYDADHIIDAIQQELWVLRQPIDEFTRPNGTMYVDMLMKLMPPVPNRHIIFGYGKLQPRARLSHYLTALPLLVLFVALVKLQIWLVPGTRHSVFSAIGMASGKYGFVPVLAALSAFWTLSALYKKRHKHKGKSRSKHTFGILNQAAVSEEQAFREGSESWTFVQRVISCFAFGAIHLVNLIYPIATILPLSIGGAVFMRRYLRTYRRTSFRRSAVLESAILHRIYNRLALATVIIVLITLLSSAIVGALMVFFLLAINQIGVTAVHFFRRGKSANPEFAPR